MDPRSELAYLLQQGYCCTEALVRLGLLLRREENESLARASSGLCNGMHTGLTCGALTGGCLMLSLFDCTLAARKMIPELCDWFDAAYGMEYGSINCEDIRGDDPRAGLEHCRELICAVALQCVEILRDNHLLEV